jgi:hypothetical protein
VSLGMGAVSIVIFAFLLLNRKKLVVIEATEADSKGNTVLEKINVPNNMEQASNDKPAGKVVEENAATEELKPIEGEEYVAEEALTPEEVSSQEILAWSTLIIGTLVFMIVSLFSYPSAIASPTNQ